MEWIKTSDILPDEYVEVIIFNGSSVDCGYHTESIFFGHKYSCDLGAVTHWMKQPEPPKEIKSKTKECNQCGFNSKGHWCVHYSDKECEYSINKI